MKPGAYAMNVSAISEKKGDVTFPRSSNQGRETITEKRSHSVAKSSAIANFKPTGR